MIYIKPYLAIISIWFASNSQLTAQEFLLYYENTYGEIEVQEYYKALYELTNDSLRNLMSDAVINGSSSIFFKEYYGIEIDNRSRDYSILLGFLSFNILSNRGQSNEYDLYHSAWLKQLTNDFEGAIFDYTKALNGNFNEETYPKQSLIYSGRGECKFEMDDFYGAISDLSKALEVDQNSVKNLLLRGRVYGKLKMYNAAIRDFSHVIDQKLEKTPILKGEAYYYRGISQILIDRKKEGCLDLSKAGELGYSEAYNRIKERCN